MFEATVEEELCHLSRQGARWLATGWNGGYVSADCAVNMTVPTGFDRTDLRGYVRTRRDRAGVCDEGPALLTGVDVAHARGARAGSVTVLATAGLSNPATLPLEEATDPEPPATDGQDPDADASDADHAHDGDVPPAGTVNLLVGTTQALDDGALATQLATAVEAKTATVQALTGFTGTTSDAVAVGCVPDGESAPFAGSATAVGTATRACVRDAIRASLDSRYADRSLPTSVAEADHGTKTTRSAAVFRP